MELNFFGTKIRSFNCIFLTFHFTLEIFFLFLYELFVFSGLIAFFYKLVCAFIIKVDFLEM